MGLLRTGAPLSADLNLLFQLAMGLTLLAGRRLAQRQRFRAHGRCQAAVMILNLAAIGLVMLPSFSRQVAPNVSKIGGDTYYAVAAAHAALGTMAELLGLYVVAVASGWRAIPAQLRFHNYRGWMRTTLALWWIVIALGIGTYGVWYGGESAATTPPSPEASTSAVTVRNFTFEPALLTVRVGTTVTWTDELGRHTVETADGFLNSGTLVAGARYEKRFDRAGVYDYYCGNHGSRNGSGMTGRIVVTAR